MPDEMNQGQENATPESGTKETVERVETYAPVMEPVRDEVIYDMTPPEARPVRYEKPLGEPMRLVFGDMAGVVFLVWIPVFAAFIIPWSLWIPRYEIIGDLNWVYLVVALLIAIPPWIVLICHLARGRLWDGILDMFLWAIWECGIVILLCYLYPDVMEHGIWHASSYWDEMSGWLATGIGTEGDPRSWGPIHASHTVLLIIGAFIFGLPALVMGVLQLNYMNFYVAQCLLRSDDVLLTLPVAWHFWSIIRVGGYIVLASTVFQLSLRWLFRVPSRISSIGWGIVIGVVLIVIDAVLKWQFAESVRLALLTLVDV